MAADGDIADGGTYSHLRVCCVVRDMNTEASGWGQAGRDRCSTGSSEGMKERWGWWVREGFKEVTQLTPLTYSAIGLDLKAARVQHQLCSSIRGIVSLLHFPIVHLCFERENILENERPSATVLGRNPFCWRSCCSHCVRGSLLLLPHRTVG